MPQRSSFRRARCRSGLVQYQTLEPRKLLAGDVIISEFVASNNGSFQDAYGESPDWIELHNQGDTAVDLQGYHLTDDLTDPIGWTFDSPVLVQPGEYIVVSASGRNEVDFAGGFHTDFKLSAEGDYLALYDADLNLKSEYGIGGADYPQQITDVSFGVEQGLVVNRNSVAQYLIPTDNSFETTWFNNNFDAQAAGFSNGRTAIGYEDANNTIDYEDEFLTEVLDGTTSLYLRNEFHLDDAGAVAELVLNLKYDDGVGVWLNGQFLFSENAGNGFAWNSTASAGHPDADAIVYQPYSLDGSAGSVGNFLDLLVDGQNTLAIHALNVSSSSSDFLISPQLIVNSAAGDVSYLKTPTPGQPNSSLAILGPQIGDVTDTATIALGQSLTVSAAISQFDLPVDANSVQLHYRFMFGNETTVQMTDDGTGADAVAGDGIFSATLDSSSVTAGQLVRWYVTAADTDGNTSRAPRFSDSLDSAEYFGAVVTDASITTDITLIQWFIENETAADTNAGTRASIFIDGNFYDNVQVDNHGQSTRGAAFLKKSYDFDANSGDKFDIPGLGKHSDFNLLTNYADQSKVRHSLAYEILAAAGIPALSGQATTVYRNGEFYALYDLIEEGQDEYLERVGLDPNGALYKVNNRLNSVTNGVTKKTRTFEDRSDFQEVVDASSQLSGSDLSTWIFDNVDIPGLINNLAGHAVLGSKDFGHKNMYWYRDTEGTGLWTPLPWDQDLSLGHNWNGSFPVAADRYFDNALDTDGTLNVGVNPIFQRVYSDPVLQDLFYQRLKTLSDQLYGTPGTAVADSFVYQRLEELQIQLADEIAADSAQWPLHPNYAAAAPFTPSQAIDEIQNDFIIGRRNFINNDANVPSSQIGTATIEFDVNDFDANPASGLQAEEYLRLNNPGADTVDISGWTLDGGIEHTFKAGTVIPAGGTLYVVADVVAFQNRTTGVGSGQDLLIQGNYSGNISNAGEVIELNAADGTFVDALTTPNLGLTPNQEFLRISEINYNPADPLSDAEYIEFLNIGSVTLDLSGVAVSEGPSIPFVFPNGTTLAAGARILIVQDSVAFTNAYPGVPASQIAGSYTGKLSNSGEKIRVEGPGGEKILEFSYNDNDPWSSLADGEGASLVLVDELSTPLEELDKYFSWRASNEVGGTPGTSGIAPSGVVVNEVLAHTDAPQSDSIELFNRSNSPVDISGWWLSDSTSSPLKYQIAAGTVLAAGAYITFDESDFNPNPLNPSANDFALSASGDQVILSQGSAGVATYFEDFVDFDATFNGESVGRLPNGSGRPVRLAGNSLGSANGTHAVSDLVISEIHFHPDPPSAAALAIDPTLTEDDLEFLEVANHSNSAIDLTNWRIRGEVDYDFVAGTLLAAGGTLTLLSFDVSDPANATKLAAFMEHYGLNSSTNLVGGFVGGLSNSSGRISLQQPDTPDLLGNIPHVLVDEVVYDDLAPWADADGNGQSLQRDDVRANGNFSTSWVAEAPTPAFFEQQFLLGDTNQDGVVDFLDISPFITLLQTSTFMEEADINGDGVVDFLDIVGFIDLLSP